MSCLYKKPNSPFWQWKGKYRGKQFTRSLKVTNKKYAMKIKEKWDFMIMMDDISFLGPEFSNNPPIKWFFNEYLKTSKENMKENNFELSKLFLKRFEKYLESINIIGIKDIDAFIIEKYLSTFNTKSKTKRNHLYVISNMFKQAKKRRLIDESPTELVEIQKEKEDENRNRLLTDKDISIIANEKGKWHLYYLCLYRLGQRAGDVANIRLENIDFQNRSILMYVRKLRKELVFPIHDEVLAYFNNIKQKSGPVFPELYSDDYKKLNSNIAKPRKYLQKLLAKHGLEKATLHSFRHTFATDLHAKDIPLTEGKILTGHRKMESIERYTHSIHQKALDYVNRLKGFSSFEKSSDYSSDTKTKSNKEKQYE